MPDAWGHVWLAIAMTEAAVVAVLAAALVRRRRSDAAALRAQLRVAQLRRAGALAGLAEWIAHELATPLASMMNNLGAARRLLAGSGAQADDAATALAEALSDGDRVAQMMGRMRSFVPAEAPLRDTIELGEIVREAVLLVETARIPHGVSVTMHLSRDLPRVRGDPVQLLQVVISLLMNAIDAASTSRHRTVALCTARADRSVQLVVSDSGKGVSERDRPHLFEPFFTTRPGDLGAGLPMARAIVEAHGGTIVAERPASGAAFRVTLPAAADAVAAAPPSAGPPARRGAGGAV
jgi:C4-dicarboxylate-specific signal transduction histidine kinase